jgi:hypothetical protein
VAAAGYYIPLEDYDEDEEEEDDGDHEAVNALAQQYGLPAVRMLPPCQGSLEAPAASAPDFTLCTAALAATPP